MSAFVRHMSRTGPIPEYLEPALACAPSQAPRIVTDAARKTSQAMGSLTDGQGSPPFQKHYEKNLLDIKIYLIYYHILKYDIHYQNIILYHVSSPLSGKVAVF